jgi:hypothetical protein
MGMPSAYWPGLSWGTRPTQLGVTGSFFGSGLLSLGLLGAVALAVGIVVPQWRICNDIATLVLYAFYPLPAIALESPAAAFPRQVVSIKTSRAESRTAAVYGDTCENPLDRALLSHE